MTTLEELGGWPAVLGPLVARRDLPAEATRAAMTEILEGAATPAQLAGFVVALRMKGETVDELSGLLDAMLAAAALVEMAESERDRLVDIVGTGGDRSHTINVSTLASFVVAGAGVPVCKHGNRAASSACGSADLLEALGVHLELSPDDVVRCIETAGMAFCFAPRFHPALRHAGPPRRELGVPTAFNILGPMANPAQVRRLVVGLADATLAERMLGVLRQRGAQRVMIVHGDDGLDELTTTACSTVWELDGDTIRSWSVDPKDLGLAPATSEQLVGGDAATNARLAHAVLAGEAGPHRDVVVLNAAAGLLVGAAVGSMAEGIAMAGAVIDDGRAAAALDRLVTASQAAARAPA
jgi:anthranilate phosphoribosyltransferase